MSKAEVDRVEARDMARGGPPMRPRDAATLLLLDRRGDDVFVLMGRRHTRHAFMPGKFVFPGGRTDPSDARIPVADELHPDELLKLGNAGSRGGVARARSIALSAIRETYEEAGLLVGVPGAFPAGRTGWEGFGVHGVRPALGALRFVARAITPPGRVRRFDTRFLACWRDAVAVSLPEGGPTEELEDIVWLPLADAMQADVPNITKTVLQELAKRLHDDPQLRPGGPVPYYRMVRTRFVRDVL